MTQEIYKEFSYRFKTGPQYYFFCPGRVNLIGEHIDYNGGRVMPCTISAGTYVAISKNTDKKFRFQCLNFSEKAELHLQSSYSKTGNQWFNYPLGIINDFIKEGHSLSGLDMLFYGNIPIGAGLSSSASIEVVTAFALNKIFQLNISLKDLALISKKVENEFIGVNCGIMDQFAVAMGKKDKAILLNCETLEHEYIPFQTGNYSLAIINSNKQRTLLGSKYNERFTECGAALRALKKKIPIQNLCDLDMKTFETYRYLIEHPVLQKRALHVISENERVGYAVNALKKNDLLQFGQLMFVSHQSLKEDYEVSGRELDTIIEFCKTYSGCIGARMTGAGFGGCAIALIQNERFADFSEKLISYYKELIGYAPAPFVTEVGDGVKQVTL